MLQRLLSLFRRKPEQAAALVESKPVREPMRIDLLATAIGPDGEPVKPWTIPKAAPGVLPSSSMAMDSADADVAGLYSWASMDQYAEGLMFLGYPALAQMAQRAENRRPVEQIAKEMTRAWLVIKAKGDKPGKQDQKDTEAKAEKIRQIEAEFTRLNVQRAVREMLEHDGLFGRGQILVDLGDDEIDGELAKPLAISKNKVNKAKPLKALRVIEPVWTYPGQYNSTDPTKDSFYKPKSWYVLSKEIHASRLLTYVSREVPDMLKPAYLFGGISLVQMMKPYVDNWLRTRQSVSDLLHSFNVPVLKTNMQGVLQGGAADNLIARVTMWNKFRDNRGTLVLDKDSEEFAQIAASLGTLDKLQAQAQEQMAAVCGLPLVVLLGITPSGLNASSEGEMDAYRAWIHAQQEHVTPIVDRLLKLVQLSLFDEVDENIGFDWNPLKQMDEMQQATIQKTKAETDQVYVDMGSIDPSEVRTRLATDSDSPYPGLDLNEAADPGPGGEDDLLKEIAGMLGETQDKATQ